MLINYDDRRFRPVSNSDNGETSGDTLFHYHQSGNVLTCAYSGGDILSGHLVGIVHPDGTIAMRYHHVNVWHQLMTGKCHSRPEVLPDGRIRLHEEWQWTSGDMSKGSSVLEEVV